MDVFCQKLLSQKIFFPEFEFLEKQNFKRMFLVVVDKNNDEPLKE